MDRNWKGMNMRCIFCKSDSSNSKSVEHIVPESLGNKSYILPKGIVCDSCNNYFALKVEKPVLEMPYFQSLRGRNVIANKKGKIPKISGFTEDKYPIDFVFSSNDRSGVEIQVKNEIILNSLKKNNKLYFPIYPEPAKENLFLSKFIGKIAIEALASRFDHITGWQNDFVNNESINELRNFVRYGCGHNIWPYHMRRIYSENLVRHDYEQQKTYETLYEYDFLIPDPPELDGEWNHFKDCYFVIAIMGVEYTINMTGNGLDRYNRWIVENPNKSILLMEKSEFNQF